MYQTDLTETEWQYITKVLNLQVRKRKYDLRMIWNAIDNVHDSKAAYLLMRVLKELCSGVKIILADGGYRGELIENVKTKFGYIIQVVVSAYKEQRFWLIHKRWIVDKDVFMAG
ncbi:hypothetical protein [Bacteroides sp.]|uniref:hypothetical protein n=1 Tax=Bacteroides sp. TaxID=29523 RepID=UPI002FC78ADA